MSDQSEHALLATLAERAGIAPEYFDIYGTRHITADHTKRAILTAMGFQVDSPAALTAAIHDWDEAPWRRPCDPVRIVYHEEAWSLISCYLVSKEGNEQSVVVRMQLRDEAGDLLQEEQFGPGLTAAQVRIIGEHRHVRIELPLSKPLPLGYYDVSIHAECLVGGSVGHMRLIVAPRRCYVPSVVDGGQRLWGLALQLYSLPSERNWGCGDFSDLNRLVEWMGNTVGAGLVGLNPLHAIRNTAPHHTSPYAPLNRLALNELYVDVERLPEFSASGDAQALYRSQAFQSKLEALRKGQRVDYDAIASAKRTMLEFCYLQFLKDEYAGNEPDLQPQTARAKVFERFVQTEGEPLELYAIFQTLEEERRFIQSKFAMWPEWPEQFRSPGPAVRAYGKQHSKRVRFFQYVQWIASEQLAGVRLMAEQAGMPVGLYNDLALGAERNGAEVWMYQSVLALDADCGAPPDDFSVEGQNWGLPPVNPIALRANRFELLIQLLRKNLRFGGAIRLDHVMAFCRLFWIPRGQPASEGAYVHYPFKDLLAIIALESVRAKTLVIGEDLGTVPDWVREQLSKARVLSYRVFYFERHGDGTWKAPSEYPEQALAVVTTHDLPTLTGYWSGEDIRIRVALGLFPDEESRRRVRDERERDKGRMLAALKREGLLPDGMEEDSAQVPVMSQALCRAIHIFLARTPSWVVLANLEDGLEEVAQTNMPGTVDTHPNWNRKYAVGIDEILSDQRLRELSACLRSTRPVS